MTIHALNDDYHHHEDASSKVIFGFWVYLMTDCILFATLFATYAVIHNNTFGGPVIQQVAGLPLIFKQTLLLLTSSFVYGLGSIAARKGNRSGVMLALLITFLLGLTFIILEFHQFAQLLANGISWQTSAFLSSYFSLVGVHAAHLLVGLLWIVVLMIQLLSQNLSTTMQTRLTCLGLFWNFLNIVWIFIFTIVYLMGAI